MKVSYTALEFYSLCPRKYKYKYVDRLEADKTFTPLLFGKSIDNALNYILICKKNNEVLSEDTAISIFEDEMKTWDPGKNELIYFKSEAGDTTAFLEATHEEKQQIVWLNLLQLGHKIIKTFVAEILPMFKEVNDVQIERVIENESGDQLKIVIDFVATVQDGTKVVFDNKTTSLLKNYPKNSVLKSKQLAMYSEFYPDHKSGYIAIQKQLVDGEIKWKCIIDTISEEMKEETFKNIQEVTDQIKTNEFDKNTKACYSFGRKCEYYSYCHFGNSSGLRTREYR